MSVEDLRVDYCPIHQALFSPYNRIECHSRMMYLNGESFMPSDPRRLECEWWNGNLTDLKPTNPNRLR